MREILFKAKRLDNGEWVEGYYFERRNTSGEIIASVIISDAYEQVTGGIRYFRSDLNYECFKVDPSTRCQYTGLTDKKGKKTWENDVVNKVDTNTLGWHRERKCSVSFDKLGYWLLTTEYGDGYCLGGFDSEQLEVIGNIFDNPELLKEEVAE